MNATPAALHLHSIAPHKAARTGRDSDADPVTTQIIRHALNSAARQMKRAAIRTSFSPIIYEALDFAVVLYDRQIRMLAQAPTLPIFMGTMSFCIEGAVNAVGGEQVLEPGDVLIYNTPYGTGSHAQDCAIVMPVFLPDGELVGYAANKGHWLDIGAKAPYCTDTTDVYQEGVMIPGVKLYKAGKLNDDIYRMVLANCRFRKAVEGDLNAQVASCHVGSRELLRVIERFGYAMFKACVERMFDHGEHVVREAISRIPAGTYRATCHMDNNGVDDLPIEFEVGVTIDEAGVRMDFTNVPDAQRGPVNCPLPSTVSAARITLAMLAGGANETPNEGHFRPLEVLTRPGSMFHPFEPQPCYLYGWPLMSAMEGIFQAFSEATSGGLPSGSAGDIAGVQYYGNMPGTGEPFYAGSALPVGQGALPHADGATLFVPALAQSQTQSPELQEAKLPIRYEKWEFTPDSAGAGQFRGGSGWELHFRLMQNVSVISVLERTKVPGWAQRGGVSGTPNRFEIDFADGHTETLIKVTDRYVPAGSRFRVYCGGGGGYGPPADRASAAVERDLLNGMITPAYAKKHHPHALQQR
ncbi:MAG: hydantoinase B/oxoprolinase family protein [Gammaproteobacteria bacterium]